MTYRWGEPKAGRMEDAAATEPLIPASLRDIQRKRDVLSDADAAEVDEKLREADTFIGSSHFDEARRALAIVNSIIPLDDNRRVQYHERLGSVELLQREFAAAENEYAEAIKMAAQLGFSNVFVGNAYAGLGLIEMVRKNKEHAAELFKKALEIGAYPGMAKVARAKLAILEKQ
jgi:tetratricopeptide (TPR) repeat protein